MSHGGLYPEPGRGGAGRGGAEPAASPGLRPAPGSTALPAGEQPPRLRRAKVRCLRPWRENNAWDEEGRRGTASKCRERWRESREMRLLPAGSESERGASGSSVRRALRWEPAGVRGPEVIERLGCGKRPQSCETAIGISVKERRKA